MVVFFHDTLVTEVNSVKVAAYLEGKIFIKQSGLEDMGLRVEVDTANSVAPDVKESIAKELKNRILTTKRILDIPQLFEEVLEDYRQCFPKIKIEEKPSRISKEVTLKNMFFKCRDRQLIIQSLDLLFILDLKSDTTYTVENVLLTEYELASNFKTDADFKEFLEDWLKAKLIGEEYDVEKVADVVKEGFECSEGRAGSEIFN